MSAGQAYKQRRGWPIICRMLCFCASAINGDPSEASFQLWQPLPGSRTVTYAPPPPAPSNLSSTALLCARNQRRSVRNFSVLPTMKSIKFESLHCLGCRALRLPQWPGRRQDPSGLHGCRSLAAGVIMRVSPDGGCMALWYSVRGIAESPRPRVLDPRVTAMTLPPNSAITIQLLP